jgi:hypothetical protein
LVDINITASFNSGEWNPALYARVDLQKYRSAAALLSNFFVDYRGGASSRPGTKYVITCWKPGTPVRLIPFQAAFNVGYCLELGDGYIRFIYQGAPVVQAGRAIAGATNANPCVISVPGNPYAAGDVIYVTGVAGMTQLNGRYFQVLSAAAGNLALGLQSGVNLDSTTFGAYVSGGVSQRIYTIASPWAAADLALIKFAQQQNMMVLCHPSYTTQILTLVSATNWSLAAMVIGSTVSAPAAPIINTTAGAGSAAYQYVVTAIDASGQESEPSPPGLISNIAQINQYPGSIGINWVAVPGATAYNVYKAEFSFFGVIPDGSQYGFIGTTQGVTLIDTNIAADFSQTPPVAQNPFVGSGIASVTVTANGTYTTVPTVTTSGGSPTVLPSLQAKLQVMGAPTITSGGTGFVAGDSVNFGNGLVMTVKTVGAGAITSWSISSAGAITAGSTPANPIPQQTTSGAGTGATATATWGVGRVIVAAAGAGFISTPTVNFSAGAAAATANLSAVGNGNPAVPSFFQQRLVLAAPNGAPQTFYMSQPGSYFNFNITDPVQADNAITATLVASTLNTIKSIVSVTSGMLIITDKASWMVTGGGPGTAITPSATVANAQSYVGASDVPPIVANYDVLYPQSKGSSVRDLTFNIYFNTFTGTDISILASHLFYGYVVKEWAWAEQPFYVLWTIRSDGTMLTLTFLKDQDFLAWTHHTTTNGLFESVCTVTEPTVSSGTVDAVYTVVQRTIQGQTTQYIERFAERTFPTLGSCWMVDCAVNYVGGATLTFQGGEALAGQSVTGLATDDQGKVTVQSLVMPASGIFTLPAPPSPATGYTGLILGLPYTYQLQTLPLEHGREPIQGKVKKTPYVDVRVNQTLNLSIGSTFGTLVNMKDTQLGNVSSMLTGLPNQVVGGLVSGDARTFLDPTYTVLGQFCIQGQSPWPATVLGVFPSYVMGDE